MAIPAKTKKFSILVVSPFKNRSNLPLHSVVLDSCGGGFADRVNQKLIALDIDSDGSWRERYRVSQEPLAEIGFETRLYPNEPRLYLGQVAWAKGQFQYVQIGEQYLVKHPAKVPRQAQDLLHADPSTSRSVCKKEFGGDCRNQCRGNQAKSQVKGVELAREDDPDPEEEEENANSVHLGEIVVGKLGKVASDRLAARRKGIQKKRLSDFFHKYFWENPPSICLDAKFSLVECPMDLESRYTILAAINLLAFGLFVWDKWLAKTGKSRVPEWKLLSIMVIGGVVGSIVAMVAVRHKKRKQSFLWRFYLCAAMGLALILWLLTGG